MSEPKRLCKQPRRTQADAGKGNVLHLVQSKPNPHQDLIETLRDFQKQLLWFGLAVHSVDRDDLLGEVFRPKLEKTMDDMVAKTADAIVALGGIPSLWLASQPQHAKYSLISLEEELKKLREKGKG